MKSANARAGAARAVRLERCAACGAAFACGADAAGCWCAALPPLSARPQALAPRCLCEACLRKALDDQARTRRAAAGAGAASC